MIIYYICFRKLATRFTAMEVRNSQFALFIDVFTPNTYIMVVMSDPTIRKFIKLFLLNSFLFNDFF